MLDWNAPLSEQPQSVQKHIREYLGIFHSSDEEAAGAVLNVAGKMGGFPSGDPLSAISGKDFYRYLEATALGAPGRGGDVAASQMLARDGIPGTKYFDAAGGGRTTGEGTRNFVGFDESLLDIVKRNDQPIKGPLAK